MGKTLEAQGDPLKGGPYPPNLPDPPRTSLHGNRRIGGKNFSRFLDGGCRTGKFLEFGGRCGGDKRVRLRAPLVGEVSALV